jgi:DME family drug/metabolite transporter
MTTTVEAIDKSSRGAWMVLAAGVLWGTTGTAQAFAPAGTSPLAVGAVRLAIGGAALLLLATALAVTGCTLLVATGGALHVDAIGVLLALGAGASYALYTIAGRELLALQPPDAVTAVAFFGGALLLAPLLFFVDLAWLLEPRGLLVALHLGLITTALSYILYIRALLTVPTATAVTLALMEPLTAATLGVLVLGERLTAPALVGIVLLLGGLLILTIQFNHHQGEAQA